MSDNKLLSENTIRRFMKLANTEALSSNFLGEMAHGPKPVDKKKGGRHDKNKMEETPFEEETLEESEEELEEMLDLEEELDLEEQEEDEMEIDADMGAAPADDEPAVGAADMSLTEEEAQVLIALGERLSEAMGGAEDMDEPEMDEPAMDEPEMDEPDDEEPAGYGSMSRGSPAMMQESLVQEVLKRVTKRLVSEKLRK
jgi:hypothetical protein